MREWPRRPRFEGGGVGQAREGREESRATYRTRRGARARGLARRIEGSDERPGPVQDEERPARLRPLAGAGGCDGAEREAAAGGRPARPPRNHTPQSGGGGGEGARRRPPPPLP